MKEIFVVLVNVITCGPSNKNVQIVKTSYGRIDYRAFAIHCHSEMYLALTVAQIKFERLIPLTCAFLLGSKVHFLG